MGKMNNLLGFMRLNDPDDEEEFYDDDYDMEEDEPVVVKKAPKRYEEPVEEPQAKPAPSRFARQSSKVVPIKQTGAKVNGLEVCVFKPTSMEDAREISDTLNSGRAVILNLEGIDMALSQRITDFTGGACYSTGGNLQRISTYIFICTPESVDVSGDFETLADGFGGM